MQSLVEALAIVGLVVMLHVSPIPLGRLTCGFCQSCWLAYLWFGVNGYVVGKTAGPWAGFVSAWVGVGCTALVAMLVAVFTPAFRDSDEPSNQATDD